jgi:hypothetical protein
MNKPTYYFVFDVESVGLHGEGFSVGFVVIRPDGSEVCAACYWSDPEDANGTRTGLDWVKANCPIPMVAAPFRTAREVRDAFWSSWQSYKDMGAVLAADVAWPVEARFLIACIDDAPQEREWQGPYPLIDIASVRLAKGMNPLGTESRRDNETPAHDPLNDARQSARLLLEAFKAQTPCPT